jgi:hypothetical protein
VTRRSTALLWAGLGLALLATPAAAQTPATLMNEGLAAYEDLEFALAARLLRRAVFPDAEPALSTAQMERALVYLGASEVLLGEQNQAAETFRGLVLANPRFRPNELVFPPRVTRVYGEVLQTTKAVDLEAPLRTLLVTRTERIGFQVFPTSEHRIRATIVSNEGATVRVLYDGVVEGPRTLAWDGLDGRGRPPASGNYRLEIESMVTRGNTLRSVWMPITLEERPIATVATPTPPPDSLLKNEKRSAVPGLSILIPSAVVSAALVIPALGGDAENSGARITVGAAVGLGGLIGFVLMKPGAELPDNVAYNDSLRADWSSRSAEAEQENRERQGITRFMVYTGPLRRVEGR